MANWGRVYHIRLRLVHLHNWDGLTKSGERDEASNHEDGMQIELLLGTLRPGEAIAVEHHPEEG